MGRNAERPVLVHPPPLGKRRAVRHFDVAAGLFRACGLALHTLEKALRAALDPLVGRRRPLTGRNLLAAPTASSAASQRNDENGASEPSFHGQVPG